MWLEATWVEAMVIRAMGVRAMVALWWAQGAMEWGVASEIET